MSVNPEQHVLDAIDELVDWQLEEGHRRGDGPDAEIEDSTPGGPPPSRIQLWDADFNLIADTARGDRIHQFIS
ncbi:hypothetical protein [Nocardia nova]|uniref:hypothetical protein n=1 Tax=Nocardia nova TaxID=37330 RepID=UPI00273957C8|nr:hypothetical protein [Nocardia nova]